MDKKLIILFLAIVIGFIMVSIPYLNNDVKAKSDYEKEIQSIDSDGDHLYDYYEVKLGTDPYNSDSDFDFISDIDELYLGTSPVYWDTDYDNMADGNEKGERLGSTSAFKKDTDNDGLPDPWEDNDGDDILNREEQLPMHDGIMYFTDPFYDTDAPESQLAPDPNNADTDGDGWNDGFEIQVNSTFQNSVKPTVDRKNNDLDISKTNSWAYRFWANQGWDSATFADWRNGLKLAGSYNVIPSQCTNIAWYHFSPYYYWEQINDTLNPPHDKNFTAWKDAAFHGPNEQLLGALDRKGPYRWNNYDCDPVFNDTDGDVMDDNWDPYPLRINLRNGTFAAINSIRLVGKTWISASAPIETTWNYFGTNISTLEIEKGDMVDINVSVGLQQCNPNNATHTNYLNGYYNPTQVVIRFGSILLGVDGKPHSPPGAPDDDLENYTSAARVTRTFTNFDNAHVQPGMREVQFTNHLNINTTITFFFQEFRIRVPSRVPAGYIAITIETETERNFHYFPSDSFMVY